MSWIISENLCLVYGVPANVGIGTTSPRAKLDIAGIIQTNNAISFNTDLSKSASALLYRNNGNLFFKEKQLNAFYERTIPNVSTAPADYNKYYEIGTFSFGSLQGIFTVELTFDGDGYGQGARYIIPTSYRNDFLFQYSDGLTSVNNVWIVAEGNVQTPRHLLNNPANWELQYRIVNNIVEFRLVIKGSDGETRTATARIKIYHSDDFANSTYTEDTGTGIDSTSYERLPSIISAPIGRTLIENTLNVMGNVGIGMTSPEGRLVIKGAGTTTGIGLQTQNSSGTALATMLDNGNVGIGTASPGRPLHVRQSVNNLGIMVGFDSVTNDMIQLHNTTLVSTINSVNETFNITNSGSGISIIGSGNVGIGTTSPTAQLHTTGTVRFANFGAGSLQTDADGNLSVSSDERLKNVSGSFERGLESLLEINPIVYRWNDASGMETENKYAGFSAQNIQSVIPEAVGVDSRGYLTLSDRPILATTVNGIKELKKIVDEQDQLMGVENLKSVFEKMKVSDLFGVIDALKKQDEIFEKRITDLEGEIKLQKETLSKMESLTEKNKGEVSGGLEIEKNNISEEVENIFAGLEFDNSAESLKSVTSEVLKKFFETISFDNNNSVIFRDRLIAEGGIEIAGEIVIGKDSAGYAIIKENSNRVKVIFEKEYTETPLVSVTLSAGQQEDQEMQEAVEELILLSDIRFIVTNVTKSGFEIKINQPASADIPFMWMVVSGKNPNTFLSEKAENENDQTKITTENEKNEVEKNELPVENINSSENISNEKSNEENTSAENLNNAVLDNNISESINQSDGLADVNRVE